MDKKVKKPNQSQIEDTRNKTLQEWKAQNVLGFPLWKSTIAYPNGQNDIVLDLECIQGKYGLYIVQVNQEDQSFLIFKTNSDFSPK